MTPLKILGVTITLSMSEHVRDVVLKCAQSLHVINVPRRNGMNDQALQAVYRSVVLAKLLYASSAWWGGFTTTGDRHRIVAVVGRGVRAGVYPADGPIAAQLVEDYDDDTLFSRLMNFASNMCCINFSLPKVIITTISGRDRIIFPSLMPWTTVTSYLGLTYIVACCC